MRHDSKIVFSGVALVWGKLKYGLTTMEKLQNELDTLMIKSNYLDDAPFLWVGLIIRYGIKNKLTPDYQRINKKWGDLPLAVELDMRVLQEADQKDPQLLKEYFEIAALEALIHAGKKYKLKTEGLEKRRAELGDIPDWSAIDPEFNS